MIVNEVLPPPQPKDAPGIRPALNVAHLFNQVRGIQTYLHQEREKKNACSKDPR